MNLFSKTLAAGAAALTLGLALAPAAEARHFRHHGWHGHHCGWHGCGWRHPRPWAPAIGLGVYGGSCYIVRQRVWSDDLGRFVRIRRTVCS